MIAPTKSIKFISLVFFISGCAALAFETVWFRIASTVLGSSVWSAAAVLMAFMTGLSLGNGLIARYGHKVSNPILVYAIVEVLIGTMGVLSVLILPLLSPVVAELVVNVVHEGGGLNIVRFLIAFTVLLIPAVAMGTTLPIMQKLLSVYDEVFSRSLGRLYGWNTLGAVVGTLSAEFFLIKIFGLTGTALTACLLNFMAAILLMKSIRLDMPVAARVAIKGSKGKAKNSIFVLLAPFTTGLILLALEVIWFRYMLLTQTGTSSIFAVMLATVLVGIGIGGIIVSRLNLKNFNLDKVLQYLLLSAAFTVVTGFYIYQLIFTYFFQDLSFSFAVFLLAAVILMLPTCIISGVLFPLFGEKLHHEEAETTQSSGILTLVNTLGAAVGSGVATFVLLPLLGVENSLFALVLAYLFCALLVIDYSKKSEHLLKQLFVPAIVAVVVVLLFPYGTLEKSYKIFGAERYPKEVQVKIKEGLNETLQYYRFDRFGQPHNFRLVTNNYSMSASGFYAERYMKLYAYFPYILNENIKDVLQISYGVGNTAEAITRLDTVKRFDVVDISRDILELSSLIHEKTGWFPLKDKRTTVHIEDGRFYLQTTKRHYDLITGEPPPPKIAGVVNLYSQEYFNLVKDRLNPGGMVTYWLPVHQLTDLDTVSIIKAFCLVFEDCSLWDGAGYDFMLVGSKNGIKKTSADRFRGVWKSRLAGELESIGIEKPGQLGALFMADSVLLKKITEFALPVTDNFPQRISTDFKGTREHSRLNAHLLDINRRMTEFNTSRYITSIFPQELISESLPFFNIESLIENITFHPRQYDNLNYWKALSYLLGQTDLKTLPTLYLNSTPAEQKIISQVDGGLPQKYQQEYQLALFKQMLIKREFTRAATLLNKYLEEYASDDMKVVLYKFYFLSRGLAGQLTSDEIKAIQNAGNFPAEEKFVAWISQQYIAR